MIGLFHLWAYLETTPIAMGVAEQIDGNPSPATARMLLRSETAGAFGGLAIGLNGIVTAVPVPPLAELFGGS